jgi:GTP pyrophosphokinase
MNEDVFFTAEERVAFLRAYRGLLSEAGGFLERGDVKKMKRLIRGIPVAEGYGRDHNGVNGLLRSVCTAWIGVSEIGLRRGPVAAMLLYRPAMKGMIGVEEIGGLFGEDAALIVSRLLKTSALYARSSAVGSAHFQRLLFSFAEDVRVILVMIADRVFMMREGKRMVEEGERVRLATEVSCLYVPLAHRLGLYRVKSEMEDLALKYTEGAQYDYVKGKLNETKRSRDAYIEAFIAPLEAKLRASGLRFEIRGRTKSISSIYNKLRKQRVEFEGIYDLFAIRVILDSAPERERGDCWQVYSIVTDMYQPNPQRMKDWISVPKSNGYESLHVTVLGAGGRWVEVQIRTRRMDEVAERGVAAHWLYKGVKQEKGLDELMSDVRSMLEGPELTGEDALSRFRTDLYRDEIYVFTPSGELVKLGKGATVLDFAFSIHSELGCRCVSGRVNGRNVPIRHVLENGDSVEVVTSASQRPKQDWLSFVGTSRARTKIRQALREDSARRAEYARELLRRRFKNRKVEVDESLMMRYIRKKGYRTVTEFYADIADDRLDISRILEEYVEMERREKEAGDHSGMRSAADYVASAPEAEGEATDAKDVLVIDSGLTGVDYRLAKCCNPIYGDEVFGFVSTQGIRIHRTGCSNAPQMLSRFAYRVVPVRWSGRSAAGYGVTLRVTGRDDLGIVANITSVISKENGMTLRSIRVDSVDGLFQGDFTVMLGDTDALEKLVRKVRAVKGVKQVERTR